MRRRPLDTLLSTLLAAAVAGGLATAAPAQEAPAGPPERTVLPTPPPGVDAEPLPEDTKVLRLHGDWEVTIEELQILNSIRPRDEDSILNRHLPMARGEILEDLGRHIAAYDLMAEEARERDMEITGEERLQIESIITQYASSLLYEEEIQSKLDTPSEEQLRELYEEQKDERFHQQEEIRMRHIYVSTYTRHQVEAGDTLESIAREISGDEEMADRILSDETKRPRHEGLGEDEEALPPRALVEGEILLVPVSGEAEEQARERIQAAWQRLEDGEEFRAVAREVSENENPGQLWIIRPAEQERPVMPELMDTFLALEDREYSEPLRTRHGYQIVYRERYQPEGHRPFEQVRSTLETTLRREERGRVLEEFYERLVGDDRLVWLDEEAIARPADEAAAGDVLARIGETEFTRGEMARFAQAFMESEESRDPEAFRAFLAGNMRAQEPLVMAYLEAAEYKERPKVRMIATVMEDTYLANQYLEAVIQEQLEGITEEELREYYESNKARYQEPESFELYGIAVPVDPGLAGDEAREAAVERLSGLVRGIDNLEDFSALADQTNPEGDRRFRDGGRWGMRRAAQLRDPDLTAIREAQAPGITEVVFSNGEARVFWVREAQEARQPDFEEVRGRVMQHHEADRRAELRSGLLQQYKARTEVEVLPAAEG